MIIYSLCLNPFDGSSHSEDNGDTLVGHEVVLCLALAYSSQLSFIFPTPPPPVIQLTPDFASAFHC